jgi:chemotaxis protein methyltransferase CheR
MNSCTEVEPLRRHEFDEIRRLAYQHFGLSLQNGKEELVSARLSKIVNRSSFRSFREYCRHVVEDRTGQALAEMIDALTTNFTSFFRESDHFEFLSRNLAPAWAQRKNCEVWSAACSTGEEPYSIAVCLLEALPGAAFRVRASDVSNRALKTARSGLYPAERFHAFRPDLLHRYLLRGQGNWQGWYRFTREVTSKVSFERLNLIEPFPAGRSFPLIFCRNVMIYFDRATQANVANRLALCLEPGGYLFVGHAESLSGLECPLEYVQPAIYRRRP